MRPICLSDLWLFTKQGLKCSQDLRRALSVQRPRGMRLCAKPRHACPTARSYRKHCRLNSRLWMLPRSILQASNFCQTLGDSIPTTLPKGWWPSQGTWCVCHLNRKREIYPSNQRCIVPLAQGTTTPEDHRGASTKTKSFQWSLQIQKNSTCYTRW